MKQAVAEFYWRQVDGAARVLDLGCGEGAIGALKPPGTEVHGLEIDEVLVSHLRGYTSAAAWDLDSEAPLPFPDSYFDAVVAKDILEHLQRPWRTVAEIKRVLRPGGTVVASVICYRSRRLWCDYTHVRGFTMESARRLFVDAGLDVGAVWRMGGIPGSARLRAIHVVPVLLSFPPCDWLWTSSYELTARKPMTTALA